MFYLAQCYVSILLKTENQKVFWCFPECTYRNQALNISVPLRKQMAVTEHKFVSINIDKSCFYSLTATWLVVIHAFVDSHPIHRNFFRLLETCFGK